MYNHSGASIKRKTPKPQWTGINYVPRQPCNWAVYTTQRPYICIISTHRVHDGTTQTWEEKKEEKRKKDSNMAEYTWPATCENVKACRRLKITVLCSCADGIQCPWHLCNMQIFLSLSFSSHDANQTGCYGNRMAALNKKKRSRLFFSTSPHEGMCTTDTTAWQKHGLMQTAWRHDTYSSVVESNTSVTMATR